MPGSTTVRPAGVLVGGPQLGVAHGGEEPQLEPGGAPGRGGGRPAHHDERVRPLQRAGRDPHPAALPLERLARPGLEQDGDGLVEPLAPPLPGDAEVGVLLRPVAEAEDQRDAPAGDQVEHGDVLGQADRVVQWGDHRRQADVGRLRAGRDRGREHERGGQVAVVGRVVLRHDDRAQLVLVGVGRLLQRRGVQLGPRCRRPVGSPQVVARGEHRFPRFGSTGLEAFEHQRRAHAAAGAHGHAAERGVAPGQLAEHGHDHAGAGGGDGVAEAAAAAVDVDDRRVDARAPGWRDRHGAEGLVDLEQVDVADAQAGPARAPSGWRRSAPARCGPARRRPTPRTAPGPAAPGRGPRRSRRWPARRPPRRRR